jgi:hypothetical protein
MSDMNDEKMVKVKSIKKIAKHIGKDVANEMLIPIAEMSEYIKPKEICSIIKQYCIRIEDEYLMNTLILQKIFTEVKNWVLGIQLAKMASDDKLEVTWDSEENCMIFQSK